MSAAPTWAPVKGCDCFRCVDHPFGTAGSPKSEHTVTFTGPTGTWTATTDSPFTAANEALSALQLGDAVAVRIQPCT